MEEYKAHFGTFNDEQTREISSITKSFNYRYKKITYPTFVKLLIDEPNSIIIVDKNYLNGVLNIDDIKIQESSQVIFYIDDKFKEEVKISENIYGFPSYKQLEPWLSMYLTAPETKPFRGFKENGNRSINKDTGETNGDKPKKKYSVENNKSNNEADILSFGTPRDLERENELRRRSSLIYRKAFRHVEWDENRTIAVWSPLDRVGVTTFVMNFAIYLAKRKVPIAVLEADSQNSTIKYMLNKWGALPKSWRSIIETLLDETIPPESPRISFKGVNWMPLNLQDLDEDFHENVFIEEILLDMLGDAKYYDYLFIDMPTKISRSSVSLDLLNHIDDFWVILDNDEHSIERCSNEITYLTKQYNLNTKIIFVKDYPLSDHSRITNNLEYEWIARIPDITEALLQSNKNNKPVIDTLKGYRYLNKPYNQLEKYLFNDEREIPTILSTISSYIEAKKIKRKVNDKNG